MLIPMIESANMKFSDNSWTIKTNPTIALEPLNKIDLDAKLQAIKKNQIMIVAHIISSISPYLPCSL